MVDKVHGHAAAGEALTGNLDFYNVTLTGTIDLTDDQGVFDALVEAISVRAQPVILGAPTTTAFNFAIEHSEAWMDNGDGYGVGSQTDALDAVIEAALDVYNTGTEETPAYAYASVTAAVVRNETLDTNLAS